MKTCFTGFALNQRVLCDFSIGSVHIVQVFLWGGGGGGTFGCAEEVELSTSVLWERISGGKIFVVLYASIAKVGSKLGFYVPFNASIAAI